jgi:23S rRNA pseudouridine2605 synthase
MRLQKFLAEAGVGSRRKCEDLIRAGGVTVDGKVAELGSSVDPETQVVAVRGRRVVAEAKEYWLLNKPRGVLTASSDPRGRPTVVECVPAGVRVFPVGRLDLNSTGVLLLTNDGELAARLLHPRYHVDKEYLVTVRGTVIEGSVARLRRGVELEDAPTAPAEVEVVAVPRGRTGLVRAQAAARGTTTTLRITIHEGRKRQVRRMMEAVDHTVIALHRSRFGGLSDEGLAPGEVRQLTAQEIDGLRARAFAR